MQMDPSILVALLLLVLPPLAVICTLLTGPVAAVIGRYQREEEQVTRAPVFVAGAALMLEACLAVFLRASPATQSHPFPLLEFGSFTILVDTYTLAVVVGLSVVTFLALVGADLSRAVLGELRTVEVGAVLFVWAANVALSMAANLRMLTVSVFLADLAVSAVLLTEAWRHSKVGRTWLVGCAVALPLIGWALLGSARGLVGGDGSYGDYHLVSQARPALVRSSLAGLWLAGGWLAAAGPLLIAATPRRPAIAFPSAGLLCAAALAGTMPALFRATTDAFPAPSPRPFLRHEWLSPWMAAVAVILGLAALAVARARLSPFRRLCLLGFGSLCLLAWAMTSLARSGAEAVVLQANLAGVLLPLAFAATTAFEHSRWAVQPIRLPRSAATVLPVLASIPWAWPVIAVAGRSALYVIAGAALGATLLATAAALSAQVQGLLGGPPPGVPAARRGARLRETLLVVALVALGLVTASGFLWPHGLAPLGPPIP